ncbi:hypothetical protein [Endozoicomonas lisbonensis]|uniref:Right handed beta helix domain-containing protein n=1 Tax=Endozoicomonas lisbonensis TaxID=3120522 RepID=A0ABV2SMA8_9GAMM
MSFRTLTTPLLVFLLFLLAIKSYADTDSNKICNALDDYTEQLYLRSACIDFLLQSGYSDYEPHAVHESGDLNYDVKEILKKSKSKRIVIFLAEAAYMSEGVINIEDLDIAFVGVKNSQSNKSHIVLSKPPSPTADTITPDQKPGAFIRFNSPGKQLMFKNVTLSDVNTHMNVSPPDSTKPTVDTGLINITSARRVIIDHTEIESHYHKDGINLGCGDSGLLTDFSLTNSSIKIPAESSHAIDFHCKRKGYNYNVQLAFSGFGFHTVPKERPSKIMTPVPTGWANHTMSTTSNPFSLPFNDTMIYINVEGSVKFTNSPCNRLTYTDKFFIEHQVPFEQTLFVTDVKSFEGLFAITERNSNYGTYFTHENHTRILDDTFYLQEQCPILLDQHNAKKLSNFLPSKALIQSRLGGPALSPANTDETDWKSKYEQQKTYTGATIGTTVVSFVGNMILGYLVYRYRNLANPNSHEPLVTD